MNQRKAWLLLIFCNLFWSGNYVFGKYVVGEMSPLLLTYVRWVPATALLLVIAQKMEKPDWKMAVKSWRVLAGMAVSGIIAYNMILYTALTYTSSTNAAVVSALNPALLVIVSAVLLREKLTRIQSLGIFVSFTGVLVIITGGSLAQLIAMQINRGDVMMLGAITVWTIYSIIGKRLAQVPPITATALSALMAIVILTPFAAPQFSTLYQLPPMAILGIVYIFLFPSVGSFIFWNVALREINAGKAGIFLNLIPVFTAGINLMLGVPVTLVQLTGGLLVFIGVYTTTGLLEKRLSRLREA
ncbi:DMT family transporter [Anoxynatronum buryatiense]|uniref:Threonine/homoserine efflux transporter RhtA n=1 Tax=Anoxynatronum buryatiense TaxID=489973 RepID=A0AA46AJL5_9CLOT|nr:DMT family transporter [Anoxynatronum buryatiense]SMP61528.1 Threonine/homoserine efflux transporter RhtA [Anoxynatronum buryatiense]